MICYNINLNFNVSSVAEAKRIIAELGLPSNNGHAVRTTVNSSPIDEGDNRKLLAEHGLERAPRATKIEMSIRAKIDRERRKQDLEPVEWLNVRERRDAMQENGYDIFKPTSEPLSETVDGIDIDADDVPA